VEDPIRYISTHEARLITAAAPGVELFETPNYVLGLAAAMMNEVRMREEINRQSKAANPLDPYFSAVL
jgi:hypothetical protein